MERNKAAAQAKRQLASQGPSTRELLLQLYREQGDKTDASRWADVTGWWRDHEMLSRGCRSRGRRGLKAAHEPSRVAVRECGAAWITRQVAEDKRTLGTAFTIRDQEADPVADGTLIVVAESHPRSEKNAA